MNTAGQPPYREFVAILLERNVSSRRLRITGFFLFLPDYIVAILVDLGYILCERSLATICGLSAVACAATLKLPLKHSLFYS